MEEENDQVKKDEFDQVKKATKIKNQQLHLVADYMKKRANSGLDNYKQTEKLISTLEDLTIRNKEHMV